MFLKNYPAMKIGNYLVVADMHIGITKDIHDSGVFVPRQSKTLAEKINKLKRITKAKRLIMLGDVKHKVLGFSFLEKMELERFFDALSFKDVIITKGNHDGDIEKMIPDGRNIKVRKSFAYDEYFFTHGHRNIQTKKKTIIIRHNQPMVKFIDKVKAIYTEPVWVRGKLRGKYKGKGLIMMPAFNELCGATIVNQDELLGPLARRLSKHAHCYMLDGTDLGTIAGLFLSEGKSLPLHKKKKITNPVKFLTSQVKQIDIDAVKLVREARDEFR